MELGAALAVLEMLTLTLTLVPVLTLTLTPVLVLVRAGTEWEQEPMRLLVEQRMP